MLLDREIKLETLKFDDYSFSITLRILEDIYTLSNSSPSSTIIGIFGEWGSGKTSVLKAIESFYKDYCQFPTIFYEAWKYQDDNDYLLSLIEKINNLNLNKQGKETAKRLFQTAKKITLSSTLSLSDIILRQTLNYSINDITKIMKMIEDMQAKYVSNYEIYLNEFKQTIKKLSKSKITKKSINKNNKEIWENSIPENIELKPSSNKLILIIDDLDRLTPDNAFNIIEKLRFYFDVENLIVIMGINDKILENFVKEKYHYTNNNDFSENFLEKIFHHTIRLSTSSINNIHLRNFEEDIKNKLKTIFDELNLTLTHRKWIKIINRISSKTRNLDFDEIIILESLLEELYPKYEYLKRRYPNLNLKLLIQQTENLSHIEKKALDEISNDNSFLMMPKETFDNISEIFKHHLDIKDLID